MEVVSVVACPWLFVGHAANEDTIADRVTMALSFVYTMADELGLVVNGLPATRFSDRSGPSFLAETGFPIVAVPDPTLFPLAQTAGRCSTSGFGALQLGWLPATRAITTLHSGPYTSLAIAHRTLRSWGRDNDFRFSGGPWEVYESDPILADDPRNLETRIYQPIL